MSNSIGFYKRIFLNVIPARIIYRSIVFDERFDLSIFQAQVSVSVYRKVSLKNGKSHKKFRYAIRSVVKSASMRKKNSPTYYIWMIVWVNRSTNLQKMNSVIRFSVPYSLNLQSISFPKYLCPFCQIPFYFSIQLEAVARSCSVKKVFLKILQNSQLNTGARVSFFNKVAWTSVSKLKSLSSFICLFPTNFLFIMIW